MDRQKQPSKRIRLDVNADGSSSATVPEFTTNTAAGLSTQLSNVLPAREDDEPLERASSLAELLSVPLSVIFREVPQQASFGFGSQTQTQQQGRRHKPLLSRAEAQTFLNITMLAQDLDCLVAASAKAFHQKLAYGSFSERIQAVDHPYLRPLVPLLYVLADHVPDASLLQIQRELDRIVTEFRVAVVALRQFSEQNWTLSESLMDAAGTDGLVPLAEFKRRLSDIQEEICHRIETLLQTDTVTDSQQPCSMATSVSSARENQVGDGGCSMEEFCDRVLNWEEEGEKEVPLRTQTPPFDSARQSLTGSCKKSQAPADSEAPSNEKASARQDDSSQAPRDEERPLRVQKKKPPAVPSEKRNSLSLQKENVRSQEQQQHQPTQQGTAYDVIYGSQTSVSSNRSCRMGSASVNAAELLSFLATGTPSGKEIMMTK